MHQAFLAHVCNLFFIQHWRSFLWSCRQTNFLNDENNLVALIHRHFIWSVQTLKSNLLLRGQIQLHIFLPVLCKLKANDL